MIETRPLFSLNVRLAPPLSIGGGAGERRFISVQGGEVEGPALGGEVLPVGEDLQTVRPDGTVELDIRTVIRASSGHLVYLSGRGLRHGPPETLARIAAGHEVPPSEYYFRETLYFETHDPELEWLTRCAALGKGRRNRSTATIDVFEVL
ncbi:DUF3237 family protein [Arthrobacter mangrovi]|uniref:UPF0311 protein AHIS1636_35760 n=1 Tax=Arthrobacter mangrovi TaxID=2966350 RepID=A0ABQ5MZ06_9MICC|nr:DUF3237 family protein [Arthrobacter mangrovi]GLB69133.1 hypothetical protein AHIS1636_35760 [Arthrobacter mangrovi]